jgi:hypothetical protein
MAEKYGTHTILHGLSEQPQAESPLCDASNPNSKTEGPTINGPGVHSIEDNTLKHTIPMIREVVCVTTSSYCDEMLIEVN